MVTNDYSGAAIRFMTTLSMLGVVTSPDNILEVTGVIKSAGIS
jgi:hypothetical protein